MVCFPEAASLISVPLFRLYFQTRGGIPHPYPLLLRANYRGVSELLPLAIRGVTRSDENPLAPVGRVSVPCPKSLQDIRGCREVQGSLFPVLRFLLRRRKLPGGGTTGSRMSSSNGPPLLSGWDSAWFSRCQDPSRFFNHILEGVLIGDPHFFSPSDALLFAHRVAGFFREACVFLPTPLCDESSFRRVLSCSPSTM